MIPADKQTAFNRVWNHLRTQRKRAMVGRGTRCAYLAPDGCKCAIGVFIPDGHPAQREAADVYGLQQYTDDPLPEPGCDFVFLSDLQKAHDRADGEHGPKDKFRANLIDVAQKHGLTYPERGWAPGPR